MIYLTGDTHADFTRLSERYTERKGVHLTADDYVIVCGDLGLCWTPGSTFERKCDFLEERPCTVLWVQGNHENYDMIREFAIEEWHGGKVRHIVRDKVILLERGQVFHIEGKTFFTFGGATSHDVQGGILDRNAEDFRDKLELARESGLPYRILGESWWPEELPSKEEMAEGLENLGRANYEVDYVITHCCSTGMLRVLEPGPGHLYESDILTDYFEQIEEKLRYKHWYFGHYHEDMKIDSQHTVLYRAMIPLGDKEADLSGIPRLGHPVYQRGDMVAFRHYWKNQEMVGQIAVVDPYGTFEQEEEPSYDIYTEDCLYKHILESEVIGRVNGGGNHENFTFIKRSGRLR